MLRGRLAAALAAGILLAASPAAYELRAEEAAASTTEEDVDPALKEILAKEKEARKACKIDICSILRHKKPEGPDIGCHVIKTWPKKDISKIIEKARVSWPWGNTICETEVKLKRAMLVAAMTEASYEAALDEHTVACEIDRGAEGEKYKLKLAMTPKITFENGKAVKAVINWGALEAPAVAKGVLWPATALDNQLNVLSGQVVDAVNKFTGDKCDEVKAELKAE
jgi:hypothetical protein